MVMKTIIYPTIAIPAQLIKARVLAAGIKPTALVIGEGINNQIAVCEAYGDSVEIIDCYLNDEFEEMATSMRDREMVEKADAIVVIGPIGMQSIHFMKRAAKQYETTIILA